ncbi:hypothetical protein NEAUS04_1515 [Nematocida ausubeli]|nr:hypothetical protein NEAUS07_0631 [Nematocida ausubeli]KAI5146970.1 hypothetical protein NEAUS05_0306 [Nematocida ausubeli]KAI5163380.1 hypothetical protein NEAUS04_1515 [Nematocida ausubeli]
MQYILRALNTIMWTYVYRCTFLVEENESSLQNNLSIDVHSPIANKDNSSIEKKIESPNLDPLDSEERKYLGRRAFKQTIREIKKIKVHNGHLYRCSSYALAYGFLNFTLDTNKIFEKEENPSINTQNPAELNSTESVASTSNNNMPAKTMCYSCIHNNSSKNNSQEKSHWCTCIRPKAQTEKPSRKRSRKRYRKPSRKRSRKRVKNTKNSCNTSSAIDSSIFKSTDANNLF